MEKRDLNVTAFNNDMRDVLKNQKLNFCALIASSFEKTISITAKYRPTTGNKRYITLNKNLSVVDAVDQNGWYYGVSPMVDNDMIINAISALQFSSMSGLDGFIAKHCSLFMLHSDQSEYLLDFARYSIISIAANFGVKIKLSEETKDIIVSLNYDDTIAHLEDNVLTLRGCPTEDILTTFSKLNFSRCSKDLWQISENGINIRELYADQKNIILLNGGVFYSGVLIKPVHIQKMVDRFENNLIESLILHFERSTYATVFTLDHDFLHHPLLHKQNEKMIQFFVADNAEKSKLISSIENRHDSTTDFLEEINTYLENSYNVNQIGISANVISKDGVLLMGRRAPNSIDNGYIYPSVNGNAELTDRNVSFYGVSAYEDYPTIALNQERMDFLGEVSREAYAELKLDLPKMEWYCYGLIISGNRPNDDVSESNYSNLSRRMHFNLLFEQHIKNSFEKVQADSRSAVESFENEGLIGIVVNCYKNRISMVIDNIQSFLENVTDQKDVVESLMILILFFSSILNKEQIEITWSNIITLFLSLIIILSTGRKVYSLLHRIYQKRKQIRRINLFQNMSIETKDKNIHQIIHGYSFHPAAYASVKVYIDKMLFDSLL